MDRVLEDLQVYRIATGQLTPEDYNAVLEELGWDASKIKSMVGNNALRSW